MQKGLINYIMKNNKGFTLIELMATLAILALITLIAVPAIGSVIDNADESAEASSISMIERAGSNAYIGGLEYADSGAFSITTGLSSSMYTIIE